MAIPVNLDGFDVQGAVDRMLGRPELWWQALGLFVEHFADWETGWLESVGNARAEFKRVHALRSSAATVGATRLVDVAGDLEESLRKCLGSETAAIDDRIRFGLREEFQQTMTLARAAWDEFRLNHERHR